MLLEGRLVQGGDAVRIECDGPRINRITSIDTVPDRWLAPGLLDIQVNGYGGHDVLAANVTGDTLAQLARTLWKEGVTAFCPTVTTQSEDRICRSLAAIAAACDSDPLVAHALPCIHVEGPFISREDGARGAHPLEHVRPPSVAEYERWQEAAGGRIGIITLAPEHPGSSAFIRRVTTDGVVVALGHTAANSAQLHEAVAAGAQLSTHLGNGSHAMLPRHTNYVWDQLSDDRLSASLIFDGHHLPPPLMKVFLRAKGVTRSILVSDAVAVAGLPPGIYTSPVGGDVELLPSGRLNLAGTPYMAGSASVLPEGITNALLYTDATVAEAFTMATTNPAHLLRLDVREGRGTLHEGATADVSAFHIDSATKKLRADMAIVAGVVVYRRDES